MADGIQQGVVAGAGIARNSAWTNPDPDQLETYGLIAQYALDQAEESLEADAEAPEAPEPPEPPETPAP